MDVLTFNTVVTIVTKLVYREKIEDAWVKMIAAQGEKKSMEQLTGAWRQAAGDDRAPKERPAEAGGAMAFLRALGISNPKKGGRF